MRVLVVLAILGNLYSQGFKETQKGNQISFQFFSKALENEFISVPDIPHTIEQKKNSSVTPVFKKRNNVFYRIDHISKDASVTFRFQSAPTGYSRQKDNLSVNGLFFKASSRKKNAQVSLPKYLYDNNTLKIYTDARGVYKLSYAYLVENNFSYLSSLQTKKLRLYNNGKEIPIQIETGENSLLDEEGDYILFYVEDHLNPHEGSLEDVYYDPYESRNVFYLSYEPLNTIPAKRLFTKNGRLKETDEEIIFTPEYHQAFLHLEENNFDGIRSIRKIEPELTGKGFFHHRDFILWGNEITSDNFQEYDISALNNFFVGGNDSVAVSLMMTGAENDGVLDHQVEVKLSQHSYKSPNGLYWKQARKKRLDFKVPTTHLKSSNDLSIKLLSNSGSVFLNFVELQYKARFLAQNDRVEFIAPEPIIRAGQTKAYSVYHYAIDGFSTSSIHIMEIGESLISGAKVEAGPNGYKVFFEDQIQNENARYIAYTDKQIRKPTLVEKINTSTYLNYTKSGLKNYQSNAEMLLLVRSAFMEQANDYKRYKESVGTKTELINVDHIYNEYSNGFESPIAIKQFLKDAYENWSQTSALRYVVLLGDAERSYKKGNLLPYTIPTYQYLTSEKSAYVSSDAFYGYLYAEKNGLLNLEGNPIPDLYIGRLPARDNLEIIGYLNKLKAFDNALPEAQSLILSGNDVAETAKNRDQFTGKRVFLDQASRIHHLTEKETTYTTLKRASIEKKESTNTVLQTSEELRSLFNQGLNHILFLGHGGGALWGDNQILTQESAELLENLGRYPVISSMTCFIGAFDDPSRQTLGEVLVLQADKGAIGLLGASGVSLIYNQYALSYFMNLHKEKNKYSYGELIGLAKLDYYLKGNDYILDSGVERTPQFEVFKDYVMMEFNYLGDPSVQIKSPKKIEIVSTESALISDLSVPFELKNLPNGNYTGLIECMDYLGESLVKSNLSFTVAGGSFKSSLQLPKLTNQDIYYIKGVVKTASDVYNFGMKRYKKGKEQSLVLSAVDAERHTPVELHSDLKTTIKLKLDINQNFESVFLTVRALDVAGNVLHSFNQYELKKNGDSYYGVSSFNINESMTRLDIINVYGKIGTVSTAVAGTYSVDIRPTRYFITPIENSFSVRYSDKIRIGAGFQYTRSYKSAVPVYVDFSMSHKEGDKRVYSILGSDTLRFEKVNSRLYGSIKKSFTPQATSDIKYHVSLRSDSLSKEGFSRDYLIDYKSTEEPTVLFDGKINTEVQLTSDVSLLLNSERMFSQPNLAHIASVTNVTYPATDLLYNNAYFKIHYFNSDALFTLDSDSSFQLSIRKDRWKDISPEKISLYYFNAEIKNWVEELTRYRIGSDSTLSVSVVNGLKRSGIYAIKVNKAEKAYRINVSYEIDGRESTGVHYSSIKPNVRIKLYSKDDGYVLNPDNIKIHLVGEDTPLDYTYSYIGKNNQNLSITLDSEQFNKGQSYQINTEVKGFVRIVSSNKLSPNVAAQVVNVSLSDDFKVFGNYPNPFSTHTILAYQLNSTNIDDAKLTVKIYTLSGHLIRTIDETNAQVLESVNNKDEFRVISNSDLSTIGPNYIVWDGKDDEGDEVGNGVYFCKFSYESNGKSHEKIIKLAKLKGVSGANKIDGLR